MSNYSSLVIGDIPTAYYRFNETSGTVINDSSGNGYNATRSGTITYSQAGAINGDSDTSMLFDGSSGYITCPSGLKTDGWSAFTIECWLFLSNNSFVTYPRLVSNDPAPQTSHLGFQLILAPSGDGGSGYFYVANGTTSAVINIGLGVYSASYWYHVVCTFDGSSLHSYINGAVTSSTASLSGTIGTAIYPIVIGKSPNSAASYYPGRMDELAIYNSVLNASEISRHYFSGLYGRTGSIQFPSGVRRTGIIPTTKRRGA